MEHRAHDCSAFDRSVCAGNLGAEVHCDQMPAIVNVVCHHPMATGLGLRVSISSALCSREKFTKQISHLQEEAVLSTRQRLEESLPCEQLPSLHLHVLCHSRLKVIRIAISVAVDNDLNAAQHLHNWFRISALRPCMTSTASHLRLGSMQLHCDVCPCRKY